jgi:peptidoglycan/LPS O-acetylase OafA/YrhL
MQSFLQPLHGLRGLMALWVVACHLSPAGLGPVRISSYGHLGPVRISSYGYLAVDVFFLMSGYLLMRTHAQEFMAPNWAKAWHFLRLRWWRTYPVYAASLALSVLIFRLRSGQLPHLASFLQSAPLLEGWALPGIGVNTPVWSLGVEWLGYLAFPVVACLCLRLPAGWSAPVATLVVLMELTALLLSAGHLDITFGTGAVARMAGGFVAGCLLATVSSAAVASPARAHDAALILTIGAAALVLLLASDVWVLPFLALGVWLVIHAGPLTRTLLAARPSLFLGRISFALYLVHFPILRFAKDWQPTASRWADFGYGLLRITLALMVAYVLCRVVEEPLRRFGRRHRAPSVGLASNAPGSA